MGKRNREKIPVSATITILNTTCIYIRVYINKIIGFVNTFMPFSSFVFFLGGGGELSILVNIQSIWLFQRTVWGTHRPTEHVRLPASPRGETAVPHLVILKVI